MSWDNRRGGIDDFENYDLDDLEDEMEVLLDNIFADPQDGKVIIRFPTMVKFLVLEPEHARRLIEELTKTLEILEQ